MKALHVLLVLALCRLGAGSYSACRFSFTGSVGGSDVAVGEVRLFDQYGDLIDISSASGPQQSSSTSAAKVFDKSHASDWRASSTPSSSSPVDLDLVLNGMVRHCPNRGGGASCEVSGRRIGHAVSREGSGKGAATMTREGGGKGAATVGVARLVRGGGGGGGISAQCLCGVCRWCAGVRSVDDMCGPGCMRQCTDPMRPLPKRLQPTTSSAVLPAPIKTRRHGHCPASKAEAPLPSSTHAT